MSRLNHITWGDQVTGDENALVSIDAIFESRGRINGRQSITCTRPKGGELIGDAYRLVEAKIYSVRA